MGVFLCLGQSIHTMKMEDAIHISKIGKEVMEYWPGAFHPGHDIHVLHDVVGKSSTDIHDLLGTMDKRVMCSNCHLYAGGGVCKIVKQKVQDGGYCRLAVIPDGVVNSDKGDDEED